MAQHAMASAEQQMRDRLSTELVDTVEQLAARFGPAIGAAPVSEAKQRLQWGQRDPRIADPEGLKQQLMQGGLPQEMLDPKSPTVLAIVKANPEIAPMYAQPCDDALADMLARLAEFPLRLGLLAPYVDDPSAMVKAADRLDHAWQQKIGMQGSADALPPLGTAGAPDDEQAEPAPPLAPPSSSPMPPGVPVPQPPSMMGG